ncbi:hypothetical protein CH63R_00215 [Colletotrichum higginsianum IMI 349063]|uniref:Uncharacterized protein n=1 Tax=Colletotrichum higginsianum (strain IMI 349063) TaxID=759273 RepID=A0A1B7YSK8_COLHI|nr:hypothetical protein CH63R_00215 [Colletotrichum higginsianum IMI 349063]OBR15035.1 hypothetical protein CH63R_00215 [Colletotrichum higginsianum IMI 349063]
MLKTETPQGRSTRQESSQGRFGTDVGGLAKMASPDMPRAVFCQEDGIVVWPEFYGNTVVLGCP